MSLPTTPARNPAQQIPSPGSVPVQPPSVRRPPPANRPPGQRPINARPKREPRLQFPELPNPDDRGFWRAAFLRTLVERQAGQQLCAKSRDLAESQFLFMALDAQKDRLRMQLNYWLEDIGGLASTCEVLQ